MDDIHKNLYNKSKEFFENNIVEAKSMNDLVKAIKNKKIALACLCNNPECEDYIKEKTEGATARCIKEEKKGKCVYCGKSSEYLVYFAKAY